MTDSNNASNAQSMAALNALNSVVLDDSIVRGEGAGKAYQVVAQATAIAVQDATDNLRNTSMVLNTALGVAMAQLLATGDPKYAQVAELATKLNGNAAETFGTVGSQAADVLKGFPSR